MYYGRLFFNLSNSVTSADEIKALINSGKLNDYTYRKLSIEEEQQINKTITGVFDRIIKPELKEKSKEAGFDLKILKMRFEDIKENHRGTLRSSVSNESGLAYALTILEIGVCNYVLNNAEQIIKEDTKASNVKQEKNEENVEKKENPIKKFFKNIFKLGDE